MVTNDPFNNNTSRFGARPKRGEEATPNSGNNTPPAFPQAPKQGKVNVPLPTLPGIKKEPTSGLPKLPSLPVPNTIPTEQNETLTSLPPTFSPNSNKPQRGTSNDLFGDEVEPEEDEYVYNEEEDELEEEEPEELSDEEAYEEIFGEKMPEDFNPDNDITDDEDLYLGSIFEAAAIPAAAEQTLYALLNNPNWQVRMALADNPEATSAILSKLAEDEDENVRQSVMENPNCPEEIYVKFAYDEDELLVAEWIDQDRTTSDMLVPLHKTDDFTIASSLVDSGKIPFSVKLELERKLNQ